MNELLLALALMCQQDVGNYQRPSMQKKCVAEILSCYVAKHVALGSTFDSIVVISECLKEKAK